MNGAKSNSNKNRENELTAYTYERRPIMNFSDLIEDQTIHVPSKSSYLQRPSFEPTEMNGRSTSTTNSVNINMDDLSVDDILSTSMVPEVRDMIRLERSSMRMSMPSDNGMNDLSNGKVFDWNRSMRPAVSYSDSLNSECFQPAENMKSAFVQDEKDWEHEYADIPEMNSKDTSKKSSAVHRNAAHLINLTEFSGFLPQSNRTLSEVSIGQYFSKKCEDVRGIIENTSPPKKFNEPIPLLTCDSIVSKGTAGSYRGGYSQASSYNTDDELKINSLPRVNNATYDKKASDHSVMSVSSIKATLDDNDSPRTFLNKIYTKKTKPLTERNVQTLNEKHNEREASVHMVEQDITRNHNGAEEVGMLHRMNSTLIGENENENEKENKWRQKNNDSAETESANDTIHSSFSNSILGYSIPSTHDTSEGTNNKRKRQETIPRSDAVTDIPIENLQIDTIGRDSTVMMATNIKPWSSEMNNVGNLKPESNALETRHLEFEQSPNAGWKYSLPDRFPKTLAKYRLPITEALPVGARSSSRCSNNSEFTPNDGRFPLKANRSELTWECVKLRKTVTKSFVIKNTSEKKLNLKVEVCGPGFQVTNGSGTESLLLQGNECRTISITFCPTIIGKAIGKVIFKPTRNWSDGTERLIHLWGYGGSTSLQIQGVERGPVGNSFLKLAETSYIKSTTLTRSFSIYNKGPLTGVATIFVKPKTNQYIYESHINIEPNKCAIRPDSSVDVKVTYKLRRKDLEKLSQKSCEVLTVGNLEVIIGAEPNRQRIASMLTRSGDIPPKYMQLEFLVNQFPVSNNEHFDNFTEHTDNVTELFNCFKSTDIALTINRTTLDESRDGYSDLSGIDDTVLFRTMMEMPLTMAGGPSTNTNQMQFLSASMNDKLTVHPKLLSMDTMDNSCKKFTIQNNCARIQTFQIDSNLRSYLNFSTTSGRMEPNQEYQIIVELKKGQRIMPCTGIISIFIESECVDISVDIRAAF